MHRRVRRLLVTSAALVLAGMSGAAAQDQSATGDDVFGDWLLRCAANDATRCALTQRIVNSETRDVVAEIGIAPRANGASGYAMLLSVPEGADLSAEPVYKLNGADEQKALAWRVCTGGMCRASAAVSADEAAAMAQAGGARFGYRKYRADDLTVAPVSFDGFSEGLSAMTAQ